MGSRVFRGICAIAALAAVAACSETQDTTGARSADLASRSSDYAQGVSPGTEQDLRANVGDRVFFDKESATISAEGLKTLERQAQWLARYPNVTVTIEGHCDERGTREFNLALGERRADAVKRMLMAEGIDGRRLTTISYGKERPAVVGSDEASWAQNRRAVTVVN